MLHRKGSIAREIQDYLLSNPFENMFGTNSWFWHDLRDSGMCVALDWQDGYDKNDQETYNGFCEEDGGLWVINLSLRDTYDFGNNGSYSPYIEYFFTPEYEDYEPSGSWSLMAEDKEDDFYRASYYLARDYNFYLHKKRYRD